MAGWLKFRVPNPLVDRVPPKTPVPEHPDPGYLVGLQEPTDGRWMATQIGCHFAHAHEFGPRNMPNTASHHTHPLLPAGARIARSMRLRQARGRRAAFKQNRLESSEKEQLPGRFAPSHQRRLSPRARMTTQAIEQQQNCRYDMQGSIRRAASRPSA